MGHGLILGWPQPSIKYCLRKLSIVKIISCLFQPTPEDGPGESANQQTHLGVMGSPLLPTFCNVSLPWLLSPHSSTHPPSKMLSHLCTSQVSVQCMLDIFLSCNSSYWLKSVLTSLTSVQLCLSLTGTTLLPAFYISELELKVCIITLVYAC